MAKRSQGWAAGLILLRDTPRKVPAGERAILLNRLSLTEALYECLADEVWRQQAPAMWCFLLATAVLDPVVPPAATALMGQQAPGRILRCLERAGLFVTRENHQAGVYRYLPLLRDFLIRRLRTKAGEQALADLHHRAAAHFQAVCDLETAIAHVLKEQDWESAALHLNADLGNALYLWRVIPRWPTYP